MPNLINDHSVMTIHITNLIKYIICDDLKLMLISFKLTYFFCKNINFLTLIVINLNSNYFYFCY
jgi:hypothetical protein